MIMKTIWMALILANLISAIGSENLHSAGGWAVAALALTLAWIK